MSMYPPAISPTDRYIVERTVERVTDENRAGIVKIHRDGIARHEARRAGLESELRGLDRAIAMRRHALTLLGES